jgi:hypothetical protein
LVVVDTNVPIAANGGDEVSPDCVLACAGAVRDVIERRRRLALDNDWRIISEYMHKLRSDGQPGWGDRFLKWVLSNQADAACCELVALTPLDEEAGEFEEFPTAPGLEAFDRSDRKFVAVANAHAEKPPILQALDSKWWGWKEALAGAGIAVEFLCPEELRATYEKKFGVAATPPVKARRG